MKTLHSQKTLLWLELALMVAIIFIMAFTPLGYFQTMGLSITFLIVPVHVGAIILGPKGGANLWSGFWNHQLYAVLRYGSLWNHAVQY